MEENQNNVKTKKPLYRNGWFIAIAIILVLLVIGGESINKEGKNEKLNWKEIELGDFIPEPEKKYGKISTNRKDLASIHIAKIKKDEYKKYVQKCIDNGYTIDLKYENWDTLYEAFNEGGYCISISYLESNDEMGITLNIPKKDSMKEIEWPTNDLVKKLPVPKSKLCDVSCNNSTKFSVLIGNMTISDYNEYVKECEDKGFIKEYSKSEKKFSAYNSDGYKVSVGYLGANVIEITLSVAKKEDTNKLETPTIQKENNEESKPVNNSVVSKEFKEALDSYEKFFDEYVEFMKKYNKSNGTDMNLLKDYAKYMSQYADMLGKFEAIENSDMNTAEAAYYIDVQSRITKKLLEVAQ